MNNEKRKNNIFLSIEQKEHSEQKLLPEKLKINNQFVEVYDIKPEKNIQKEKIPIFFAQGWATSIETYKDDLIELSKLGRRTIFVDAPHGVEIKGENKILDKNYPVAELRKVNAFFSVLDNKNIDKVDVVAHSEGGIYISIAAMMKPEKFRNIIFVDPAGLIGKDNFLSLAKRFNKEILNTFINEFINKSSGYKKVSLGEIIKYTKGLTDPIKAIEEAEAISKTDIINMLKEIKNKGIGVAVLSAADDKIFPMDKIQKNLNSNMVDGFYSLRGGHNEIIFRPVEYSALINDIFKKLEDKKSKI